MNTKWILPVMAGSLALMTAQAVVIGTNTPSQPMTMERMDTLPADQLPAWRDYLKRSEKQWRADHAAFFEELKKNNITTTLIPPHGGSARSIPLKNEAKWYGGEEAQRIADIVLSFQTPAGGWSKNLDMTQHKRMPGEYFNCDNKPVHLISTDNDAPREMAWSYVGTFDNDATITELHYLARVISNHAKGETKDRAAFQRGLDYIFAAQYPNGGFPQVWPLEGGYHDAITYNDDAALNVIAFLQQIAAGKGDYAFVEPKVREHAAKSVQHGIECFLATQIISDGHRTVWCQQHDPLTLAPASARNYEMPSKCGAESSEIMTFLMDLPNPDVKTVAAVYAAADWFNKSAVHDYVFERGDDQGHRLVPKPGAGPIWSRYYDLNTDKPIFGDRDKTIHDDLMDISKERRNGYSWFSAKPGRALEKFAVWTKEHPRS